MRHRSRLLLASLALAAGNLTSSTSGAEVSLPTPTATSTAVVYVSPTGNTPLVARHFQAPAGPYGSGHRGVDLDLGSGRRVRSAADGTVTFAGPVAGRGVVVVLHGGNLRTEYEPVSADVHAGERVVRGQMIGTVAGHHLGCPVTVCLHWGARRGEVYVDPLTLLRPLGPVRLLPWSGS